MKILTTEEKLSRFLETSVNDAVQQSTEIIEKYTAALESEFEDYKKAIDNEIESRLRAESNKIKILTNRELAEKQISIKRRISQKQEELEDKIFNEVLEKLAEFKAGKGYYELLKKQIAQEIEFAGSDPVTIYIDPDDAGLIDKLQADTGILLTINDVPFNGGTKAIIPAKNILINNTFKKKLEEERGKFVFYGGND